MTINPTYRISYSNREQLKNIQQQIEIFQNDFHKNTAQLEKISANMHNMQKNMDTFFLEDRMNKSKLDNPLKYFYDDLCFSPFMSIDILPDGNVYPCCAYNTNNYSFGNIYNESFEKIWYSDKARLFRQSILDKDYKFCNLNVCMKLKGSASFFCSLFNNDGLLKYPYEVEFAHDRTCNLQCITCRDKAYASCKDEIEKMNSLINTHFIPILKDAGIVITNGAGELFASEHIKKLIYSITRNFPNIKFDLYTNGYLCNLVNLSALGLIDKIRQIHISLHAAKKETYKKIVHGGDFDIVMDNINLMCSLKHQNKIQKLQLCFVISALNFREMKDFLHMCIKLDADAVFWEYRKWGTLLDEQYDDLSIWTIQHPLHNEFLDLLKDPIFDSKFCIMNDMLKSLRLSS